jgi:uncharacterized DUF497 family protein
MELVFEWDAHKARVNESKHRVSFAEAKTLFNDPFLLTFQDEYHSENEERYISIGRSRRDRILLVVHAEHETDTEIVIRIISCRRATLAERRAYEESDD